MTTPESFVDPLLVWGVFLRLLGVVQLVALGSMGVQVLPLVGSRGATPAAGTLQRIGDDFPEWGARLRRFPTLLWLTGASDNALRAIVALGCAGACCLVLGLASPFALLATYLSLLSLDDPLGLKYPWDALLLEATSMCTLLPPLLPLFGGGSSSAGAAATTTIAIGISARPHPWLGWAIRLLLFRVMFGFGKLKFAGSKNTDACYIHSFLVSLPLPSPLGWWAHGSLPLPFWVASLAGMFAIELVAPCFFFVAGAPRLLAGGAILGLQAGIQATGNFGYFNVLTAVLCVPLLDDQGAFWSDGLLQPLGLGGGGGGGGGVGSSSFGGWCPAPLVAWYVAVHTLLAALHFPFNSWCTLGAMSWPMIATPRHWFVEAAALLGAKLRLVHGFGVFPPKSNPPVRWAQVLEGHSGAPGAEWEEYEWAYMTTHERSPPRFVAPHHPRLDHSTFYISVGIDPENFGGTAMLPSPYLFSPASITHRLMQRLLEGGSPVQRLLGRNPFPDDGPGARGPPKHMRSRLALFRPASVAEQRRSGKFWHREFVAPHAPPRASDPALWGRYPQPPELSHLECLPMLARSCTPLSSLCDDICGGGGGGTAVAARGLQHITTMARFWEVAAFVGDAEHFGRWERITERALALRRAFDAPTLLDAERVWGRLTAALMRLHMPHFKAYTVEELRQPRIELSSFFKYGLALHTLIATGGEAAVAAALRGVAPVVEAAAALTNERGMYWYGLARHDVLLFHARKLRLQASIRAADAEPTPSGGVLPGWLEMLDFVEGVLVDGQDVESSVPQSAAECAERLPRWISPKPYGGWQEVGRDSARRGEKKPKAE